MGSGDIGSNGSVHYTLRHNDTPNTPAHFKDADPIAPGEIGRGSNGVKNHPGYFAVRMRFPDVAAATNALNAAITTAGPVVGGGGIYVTCLVPVVTPTRTDPALNPFYEINIDW
jgi:hypothetical protein